MLTKPVVAVNVAHVFLIILDNPGAWNLEAKSNGSRK